MVRIALLCLLLCACDERRDLTTAAAAASTTTSRSKATDAPISPTHEPVANKTTGSPHATKEPSANLNSVFLGEPDDTARASLREQEIKEIEKGRGGRSLAFKLTLADGTQGYYKPEQTFSGAHWYAELMAYYLDRELGFGRVPPVVGRRVEWSRLAPYAKGDPRLDEIIIQDDGTVRGALIWWLPKKPTRLVTGRNWERWVRVDGPLHISPYQAPIDWRKDRKSGDASEQHWPLAKSPDIANRPTELSDMIIFDYLCTNVDRWGGDNENVRTHGEGGPLLFFDNGAGFSPGRARIPLMDSRLHALQRYAPNTRERLDKLDLERLQSRMKRDPLYPFLPERSWQGLGERLAHARQYLQRLDDDYQSRAHLPEIER